MQAQVNNIGGVFVTPNGEVFFVDEGNDRVRKILRTGETVTICGTGIAGYNGDDQPATQAQLDRPSSVFVSSRNEIYISESNGHRIRKIQTNGNIVTVAGTGIEGYNGDGQLATNTELSFPWFVTVANDEVYIADLSRIRKILEKY